MWAPNSSGPIGASSKPNRASFPVMVGAAIALATSPWSLRMIPSDVPAGAVGPNQTATAQAF